ncbi:MAG: DUF2059 domain-containing protein [Pseudomonadota bacterium]
MKRTLARFAASLTTGLSALALANAAPAAAQEKEPGPEEMEQMVAQLAQAFPVEPLSDEQTDRLPQAQRIIAKMIPEGTLGEMMGSMFDQIMGPIMAVSGGAPSSAVGKGIGVPPGQLDLDEESAAQVASIFDPAFAERSEREAEIFPQLMTDMMTVMEPTMRKAMSELYAINFTQIELDDIEAFYNTPSGASFARKSFTMSSDPRVIAASMEALPQMMASIGDMERRMQEAVADLPEARGYFDLSEEEKARVAELTGFSQDEIENNLGGPPMSEADSELDWVEQEGAS